MTSSKLTSYLEIPYEELEEMNLAAKKRQISHQPEDEISEYYLKYLQDEKRIKAVGLAFSDIEGRFHMLDYDKKFLLRSADNLTFDGSSIRGFTEVRESDLRLKVDWPSFRWLPADIFGPGKVIVFGLICDRDGNIYSSDMRYRLKQFCQELYEQKGMTAHISCEIEGFLFKGENAEQIYTTQTGFELVSSGGYFHSLPQDPLKLFIDHFAESQRSIGFENEKDHPEVAPSQFELNYTHTDALIAADQVQLYKLLARQVAGLKGLTASFLPKPIAGINGSGMHTNISIFQDRKNLFYNPSGEDQLSDMAWSFIDRILSNAEDLCLIFNSSVNAYRRLDPNYEAPNQIKSSAVDRTSMVRIPLGNENSARLEIRTIAPDANPYLTFLTLLQTGFRGPITEGFNTAERRTRNRFLPNNIYDAYHLFKNSTWIQEIIGESALHKFAERKRAAANRCPKELGNIVKTSEIVFHHEVTNQYLWGQF
jgi:glutamine synthetase